MASQTIASPPDGRMIHEIPSELDFCMLLLLLLLHRAAGLAGWRWPLLLLPDQCINNWGEAIKRRRRRTSLALSQSHIQFFGWPSEAMCTHTHTHTHTWDDERWSRFRCGTNTQDNP
jgi:hypothetical protein